ncbi:MAG TPA: glycosyltransferase family 39 protein [Chloroflexota bacterium]
MPPPVRLFVGVFVLALVPRLCVLAFSGPRAIEIWEYDGLGSSIAAGHGYAILHWGRTSLAFGDGNLYSFLSGVLYAAVGHQPLVLAVVQAVIASLAVPVIYAIGERSLGRSIALMGAGLAALHPGLLAYTLKLHPLGLDVLLLALLVIWVRQIGGRRRDGVIAGIVLGLNLMSRPTYFLAGLVGLAMRWRTLRWHFAPPLLAVAVSLAIAGPWIGRNWVLLGRPIFISTGLEDVWKGNNPAATGSSYLASGQEVFTVMPVAMQVRLGAANELELNDVFGSEVLSFVREQPLQFVSLSAQKFVFFWWFSPQSGMFYPPPWLSMYQVYAAFVLSFAVLGGLYISRAGSAEARGLLSLLVTISLTISVAHALTYVEGRHRWGIEPLLLLLTAQGAAVAARYLRGFARISHTYVTTRRASRSIE